MKFKDMQTGLTLETKNEFVIGQYRKYPDRYKEVKEKPKASGSK